MSSRPHYQAKFLYISKVAFSLQLQLYQIQCVQDGGLTWKCVLKNTSALQATIIIYWFFLNSHLNTLESWSLNWRSKKVCVIEKHLSYLLTKSCIYILYHSHYLSESFDLLNDNILCWWTGDTWWGMWWAGYILQMRGGTKGSRHLKWQIKCGKITNRNGYWKSVQVIKWWRVYFLVRNLSQWQLIY